MSFSRGEIVKEQVNHHVPAAERWGGDAENLSQELRSAVSGNVCFDQKHRALYSVDASNYRQVPIGVVFPKDERDVGEILRIARAAQAPILPRGGGTSLAGQCCNIAVVLDFRRYMNLVLDINAEQKLAIVQPGTVLDDLQQACAPHGLRFGPDPATHSHCTLGGMAGNNSCGIHALRTGRTVDNTHSLKVITYAGEILDFSPESNQLFLKGQLAANAPELPYYQKLEKLRDKYADEIRSRFPDIPRRVSGYSLDELLPENGFNVARSLVGSEGTCVTILEYTGKLIHFGKNRVVGLLAFDSIEEAGDAVMTALETEPIGLEGLDNYLLESQHLKRMHTEVMSEIPDGKGWLLMEWDGESMEEARSKAERVRELFGNGVKLRNVKFFDDPEKAKKIWELRESALGATSRDPHPRVSDAWPGWEDSAVPREKVGEYLRKLKNLYDKYGYQASLYGHFGDGCIHTRINFELSSHEGIARYRSFVQEAADLVVSLGGSLSGEHGDGQSRGELLDRMFGPRLMGAFREFKAIWDPENKMNPGKVIDARPLDLNLRLGPAYNPAEPKTHFSYLRDSYKFSRAALRCVGVGKCCRAEGGTMCPSYMATRDEQHSTRGRSHLLFEMLQGEIITDGWKSEAVKEALHLCLACKGCKADCPAGVDMATYKAEFLSHYYSRRLRPRAAYSMGLIPWWSRAASLAPRAANAAAQNALVGRLLKAVGGIAQERSIPEFAEQTFRAWFNNRRPPHLAQLRGEVLLWPDTFVNFFQPHIGRATTRVLEKLGYRVLIPEKTLCCGRPLYDFGMLDLAKLTLRRVIKHLTPAIRKNQTIVGMEPSCIATFRDELPALFPKDEDAARLSSNVLTLAEFIEKEVDLDSLPRFAQPILYHAHCHHKAVLDAQDEQRVLKRMGADLNAPITGCCGMAGSFGFEAEKYDVSVRCGEKMLLPQVRNWPDKQLIVTDGFSCREQISQCTGRTAMHFAEVLDRAFSA